MNRREALERVALIFGGTVIGGAAFLQGCKSTDKSGFIFSLTPEQITFLDEVAETIIPVTTRKVLDGDQWQEKVIPGAKAAKVGAFMQIMVADCYEEKDQQIFSEGLTKIDEASKAKYSKTFIEITAEERTVLFNEINKELKVYNDKNKEGDANHYFAMMKQLTLLGYFTSEIGATQALRYVAIPGKYEGCVPYQKGDRAWA